jgi:hypothetical protein
VAHVDDELHRLLGTTSERGSIERWEISDRRRDTNAVAHLDTHDLRWEWWNRGFLEHLHQATLFVSETPIPNIRKRHRHALVREDQIELGRLARTKVDRCDQPWRIGPVVGSSASTGQDQHETDEAHAVDVSDARSGVEL